MIKISDRLHAAASLVGSGHVLADVGTDHGYVPIYLLEQKRIPRAIAMDINSGPLARAKEHVRLYGMEDYIETRLSDGVASLAPGEADTVLIAGMGGGLTIRILDAGKDVCRRAEELVLQPQSEVERVRRYLAECGYAVEAEEMVCEDGKYYPMMRVSYRPGETGAAPEKEAFYRYGGLLLEGRHPVLLAYLEKERAVQNRIYETIKAQPRTEQIEKRIDEVCHMLKTNGEALTYYK